MTKSKLFGWLALFLMLGLWAAPARAAEENRSQPYVVIVGLDKYSDQQILPRQAAEADARALYDLFVNKAHLGVDAEHVRLLLGSEDAKRNSKDATRANILDALKWVADKAGRDDLVVLAFFGQGAPLRERVCFFAKDSTFKGRAKNSVAGGDLQNTLDKLKSRRVCTFLDVNFQGFNPGKETVADPDIGKFYKELLGKEDDKGGYANSRVFFLANLGLKPSLELKGHGIFSTAVIDGLKGKADQDGYEADGVITVGELAKYVRKQVPVLAQTAGKTEEEKAQSPIILEGQATDFIIDLNPAVSATVARRLGAFDKLAGKLGKELTEEGHELLKHMPKLEARQTLRKAYQKLADGGLDVAAFRKERRDILDGMKLSDTDANTYARMVMRATDMVREGYVKSVNQGQLIDWAIHGMYQHVSEKTPSAIEARLKNVKSMQKADMLKLLSDARLHLGKREDLAAGKDITVSLHPMLGKLDRHTDYTDPETLERDKVHYTGNFSGIGVQIRKNNTKDMLQVVTPIMGSPAYKAKMYAGDVITTIIREVDSEGRPLPTPEVIPTKGMTTEDAVKKILGREGTRIKLLVEREGHAKPLEFNLLRGRVEVETVLGVKRGEDDGWNYVIDPENKICYVRLTQFSRNTQRDLERVMRQLSKVGIKGFILDLRFNPGGLLDSAVKISDMFIDDGMIVTIRPRNGAETSYVGRSDGSYTAFPMVCLVNGYSASASEIVSACLQDHTRAIVMGSRSYGKGSVQTILPFETGGQLKLTTATYWRPSGKNINKASTPGRPEDEWGVTPDKGFVLDMSVKDLNDLQDHQRDAEIIQRPDRRNAGATKNGFHDRQLDMALQYLRGQIRHTGPVTAQAPAKKAG